MTYSIVLIRVQMQKTSYYCVQVHMRMLFLFDYCVFDTELYYVYCLQCRRERSDSSSSTVEKQRRRNYNNCISIDAAIVDTRLVESCIARIQSNE
jgi:hypothetical protein